MAGNDPITTDNVATTTRERQITRLFGDLARCIDGLVADRIQGHVDGNLDYHKHAQSELDQTCRAVAAILAEGTP